MVINRIPKFLEKICGIKINVLKSLANIQHIGISANTAFSIEKNTFVFLMYGIIAFGGQLFTGLVVDKTRQLKKAYVS